MLNSEGIHCHPHSTITATPLTIINHPTGHSACLEHQNLFKYGTVISWWEPISTSDSDCKAVYIWKVIFSSHAGAYSKGWWCM